MKNWLRFSLKSLLVATACIAAFVAYRVYQYEHQTVNDWVNAVLAQEKATPLDCNSIVANPLIPCQVKISDNQKIELLRKSLRWLPTEERRNCVLKIVAEQFPDEAHDFFVWIVERTEDEELLRNAILLASIYRDAEDISLFSGFLEHENGRIRAAAIDGIGIVHNPSFPIPAGFDYSDGLKFRLIFLTDPPIDLAPLCDQVAGLVPASQKPNVLGAVTYLPAYSAPKRPVWMVWKDSSARPLPETTKNRIQHLLSNDTVPQVRSAAARMAGQWNPKKYSLRFAEWGVWINQGADLTLAQSVIDEIPPFVHRVGNDVSSIKEGRTNSRIFITKPIVHITVDQPMVLDVAVRINGGRPWFVFPMPDDFSIEGSTGQLGTPKSVALDVPDEKNLNDLEDLREGYPWLAPSHSRHYILYATSAGFRWQSLFVTPKKADWMKLETVSDPKFAWWDRLREVDTSWVDNRGESERFLYYDGPTKLPSPVRVHQQADHLVIVAPIYNLKTKVSRTHLYIEVKNGKMSAAKNRHQFSSDDTRIKMSTTELNYQDAEVEDQLNEALISYGLSAAEAQGLVDCWRPQFFKTDGKRLLTIFGNEEYEKLCPLEIRPKPTELGRVGIVLTELSK